MSLMDLLNKYFIRTPVEQQEYDIEARCRRNMRDAKTDDDLAFSVVESEYYYKNKALKRYEKETDPYKKGLMKEYLDRGFYDFDKAFGREKDN